MDFKKQNKINRTLLIVFVILIVSYVILLNLSICYSKYSDENAKEGTYITDANLFNSQFLKYLNKELNENEFKDLIKLADENNIRVSERKVRDGEFIKIRDISYDENGYIKYIWFK